MIEAGKELYAALAAAKQEFPDIIKDKENSHFRSKYADLAALMSACEPILYKHGLILDHVPEQPDGDERLYLHADLIHLETMQCKRTTLKLKLSKDDAQGLIAASTYGRRGTYGTALGVAPVDDDDGETAVGRGATKPRQAAPPPRGAPSKVDRPLHAAEVADSDMEFPPKGADTPHREASPRDSVLDTITSARTTIALKRAMKTAQDELDSGRWTQEDFTAADQAAGKRSAELRGAAGPVVTNGEAGL